jgi:hypothetical protein
VVELHQIMQEVSVVKCNLVDAQYRFIGIDLVLNFIICGVNFC